MYLTRIDILKYKSIKNPVSVYFNEGKVVTLIGKNGSGKTNVLEAIKFALSKNQFYRRDKIEGEIKYHIELTDNEAEEYFTYVQSENISKEIVVEFNGTNPEIRLIDAPIIEIDAVSFKTRLESVLENYKDATHKYLKCLKKIESSDSYFGEYVNVEVKEENHGSVVHLMKNYIEQIERNVSIQIKEIKDYINQFFKGNKISLNKYEHSYPFGFNQRFWNIPFYKIPEDEKIEISPIVAQSLNINKEALDKANKKLNDKLKEINNILETEYKEIQVQLDEFDRIKQEIASIFDTKSEERYEQNEKIKNHFESIIQKLRKAVFRNCYFIDNENSLIFYDSINHNHRNEQINQEYLNSRNPIVEAFDIFLRDKGIIDENTSITQKDKLEERQIRKAISTLNSEYLFNLIPKFESGEIIKFEVRYENGSLNLYVHEKNGDVVSFNNTSLGRRWYLTFQFVKAILKPDDMLLIDEPAAFLHPQAQTEFKIGLNDLASNGIYVFYSTHSPYMIPENWGQVYNVIMTENGSQIEKFESGDDLCEVIKHELGAINTANILFNLGKTILLVEGVADKVCLEKFSELLHRDLSDYYIHVCDGEAILQVAYICLAHKALKIKVVLDNDNKYKSDSYKRGHSMYDACINIINANPQICVYIGNGEDGCLEDLFVESSDSKYKHYKNRKGQWKVDINAVKMLESIEDVSEQTKTNFEQLFKKLGIPELD